jgi:hypothetical protein
MSYIQQRNEIDKMIESIKDETKKTFYQEKLKKMDTRKGGSHRIGITGLHSILKKEVQK